LQLKEDKMTTTIILILAIVVFALGCECDKKNKEISSLKEDTERYISPDIPEVGYTVAQREEMYAQYKEAHKDKLKNWRLQ
jgi:hypothetical protein